MRVDKKNPPLEWPRRYARTPLRPIQQYRHKSLDGKLGKWGDAPTACEAWRQHGGVVQCGFFATYFT